MINASIFKSYDVRGIYPTDLTDEAAFEIGKAYVSYSKAKKVAVCYDARLSSPSLYENLARGITSQGSDVYFIGQLPTECLYFAVGSYDFDGGVMITASHNPKEYNGFKMMVKKDSDIVWIRGKDLLLIVEGGDLPETGSGTIYEKDILPDYLEKMKNFGGEVNPVKSAEGGAKQFNRVKPFKVAVDASNGVMGKVIDKMKSSLPIEITELNFEPDGNFPNHSPNPLESGSADIISKLIKDKGLDFGIMFDGDADRIFLVDEGGNLVSADIVLLLLAKHFLEKEPGSAVAYNAICSKAVPEFIKKWGGVPVRTAVGFVNVREGLIKNNGIMGGELSAHYCFRDYFYTDSGMIAFLTIVQILSKDGRPVSEIIKDLSIYFKSAEMNFEIENKEEVLAKLKEKYAGGKQDFLDGVTVEYENWWFNARPSNTEPLLRLTIEADTQELLDKKKKELGDFIVD